MNREIKFRGKRVDNGQWEYVDMDYSFFMDESGCPPNFFQYKIVPDTVGQYTGLKDKNGKAIYESDVVWQDHHTSYRFGGRGVVVYSEDEGGFIVEGDWKKNQHHENLTCDVAGCVTVTGNIFDNPITPIP